MLEGIEDARPKGSRGSGPTREQIGPAALDLVERFGPSILRTARRYSQTPEDAEDAYQRSLEILLTKAPSTDQEDLLPWLRTVVKHEAFALRKQRDRNGGAAGGEEAVEAAPAPTETQEQVEQRQRLRLGAEAMAKLKPQELRCLLLLADGLSYRRICEVTGFSYTKVNRCLAEGRRAFVQRVLEIETGQECKRLEPLLSAIADGEAELDAVRSARRHLRNCLACRATLAEYRTAPARVAALVPPVMLVADGEHVGASARGLTGIGEWLQERVASLALKLQGATEVVTANKAAAVAASTAAIAGGGVGAITTFDRLETPTERRVPREGSGGSSRDADQRLAAPRLREPSRLRRSAEPRRARRTRRKSQIGSSSGSVKPSTSQRLRQSSRDEQGGEFAGPETSTGTPASGSSTFGSSGSGEFDSLPEQSSGTGTSESSTQGSTATSAGGEFSR